MLNICQGLPSSEEEDSICDANSFFFFKFKFKVREISYKISPSVGRWQAEALIALQEVMNRILSCAKYLLHITSLFVFKFFFFLFFSNHTIYHLSFNIQL